MPFTQPADCPTARQPLNIDGKWLLAATLAGLAIGGGWGAFGTNSIRPTTILLTATAGAIIGGSVWIVGHICIRSIVQSGCKGWLIASATTYAIVAAVSLVYPLGISPGDWSDWGRWLLVGVFLAPLVTAVNSGLGSHAPAE